MDPKERLERLDEKADSALRMLREVRAAMDEVVIIAHALGNGMRFAALTYTRRECSKNLLASSALALNALHEAEKELRHGLCQVPDEFAGDLSAVLYLAAERAKADGDDAVAADAGEVQR